MTESADQEKTRFQVNFKSSSEATLIEDFTTQLQEFYNVTNKYEAISIMRSLAQKQLAREDVSVARFKEQHYALIEAQINGALLSFRKALENVDAGMTAIQNTATDEIERTKKEMGESAEKNEKIITRLTEENSQLAIENADLNEKREMLIKQNETFEYLKNALEKNETTWQREKNALKEKNARLEKAAGKNRFLQKELDEMKDRVKEKQYELKSKNFLIDSLEKQLHREQHIIETLAEKKTADE